jgi:hypothetical protein
MPDLRRWFGKKEERQPTGKGKSSTSPGNDLPARTQSF